MARRWLGSVRIRTTLAVTLLFAVTLSLAAVFFVNHVRKVLVEDSHQVTILSPDGGDVEGAGGLIMTPESIAVQNAPPDLEIQSIVGPYETLVASAAAEQLGETSADLRSSSTEESALNDMIADALRETADTQVAFHNVGGMRARLKKGPFTFGALFDVLPFQDTLVTMNLTGAQIKRVLGRRVLAVSGLRVQWDLTREAPHYLVSATLPTGQPLQDAVQYTVVVNDFIAAGGDGLEEFTEGKAVQDTGVLLRDAVSAYLRKHPVVSDVTDGRVTIRNR